MVLIDLEWYCPYVTDNKKRVPILYVKIDKALYGLLRLVLDCYLNVRGKLEEQGYVVNSYEPCVANKTIDGSQQTVIWHVDDLKCSDKKSFVNTKFAPWLGTIYGQKNLDWSIGGKLTLSVFKYIYKILFFLK